MEGILAGLSMRSWFTEQNSRPMARAAVAVASGSAVALAAAGAAAPGSMTGTVEAATRWHRQKTRLWLRQPKSTCTLQNSSPIIVPQVGVLSVVSNIDSPQKKDEKPAKPARTLPRLPDGTCPEGTTNGNRAGCLTPYGQEQQQQEFCAAISRPLYIGALFFGGPELLGGKALLESTGMRLLGAAGAIQGGICF